VFITDISVDYSVANIAYITSKEIALEIMPIFKKLIEVAAMIIGKLDNWLHAAGSRLHEFQFCMYVYSRSIHPGGEIHTSSPT
jgi:hypothetical protein